MDFYTRALQINREGWFIVNCFQLSSLWRVNLQMRTGEGATTGYFSEYAEGDTPLEALEAAFTNAKARFPKAKDAPQTRASRLEKAGELTPVQEKKLMRALDNLSFAVKMNGTRGRNRNDDM